MLRFRTGQLATLREGRPGASYAMKSIGIWLTVATGLVPCGAAAQVQEALLPGGARPGTVASVFGAGLVSGPDQEYGLAVTGDWSEIYFTRLRGERSTIMVTRREGTSWAAPTAAQFSGEHIDAHPWLAPGGNRLYFISRRPCPGAQQALNVWVNQRTAGGWTDPASLGAPVTDQTVHAPSVSESGTIYATGLIRLKWLGEGYSAPERLSPDIRGSHPAIAPDESFLIFSARREGGFGGTDLYVVFRNDDGTWSAPSNLGSGVNTEHNESSPTLSSDGRFLFFSRREDIWWVDAGVVSEMVFP